MIKKGLKSLALSVLLLAVFLGMQACEKEEAPSPDALVMVNGEPLTVRDMEQTWLTLPEEKRREYLGRDGMKSLLDELISYELMAQEAEKRGLDEDPAFKQRMERYRERLLVQSLLDQAVSEADINRYYMKHFVRARMIKVPFPEDATAAQKAEARSEANEIWEMIDEGGSNFAKIAGTRSEHPSAPDGGDIGYLPHEVVERITGFKPAQALFSQDKAGAFTEPIEGEGGYYIMQLLEKGQSLDPRGLGPEMKKAIREFKEEEAIRSFANELKSRDDTSIQYQNENLEQFMETVVEAQTAPLPGEEDGSTLEPAPGATAEE